MEIYWTNVKFVWVRGKKYQVLQGTINLTKRCLNAFCGDYSVFGQPSLFYFDEIENIEY